MTLLVLWLFFACSNGFFQEETAAVAILIIVRASTVKLNIKYTFFSCIVYV
jgi:hypothetical protein